MFLIYSILYAIAVLVLFIPQYFKRPSDLRGKWLRNKFGNFGSPLITSRLSPIWIHAVSVGEVNAVIPLLKKIKTAYPLTPVILSTITDTGQKVAIEKAPQGTSVVYLPFDIVFILRNCLEKIKPQLFIAVETELWPNIFSVAHEKAVPVIILNGRISEKSFKGYERASFFMKKVFSAVTLFGMQSESDAERIKNIGADEHRIKVIGNFKFDMDISGDVPAWTKLIKGPVIVAGSTHAGEEQMIIDAYKENIARFPNLKLIIAPRHPERFREAEEAVIKSGLGYIKRSGFNQACRSEFNILLLDTVGELTSVYSIADMAIMGKSFTGFGGQNPLEPAYWSKPIICGPHMENFPFMKDFYAEGAAFEVSSAGIAKKIKEFLMQPQKAKEAGAKAKELYLKNSGAIDRAMKIIEVFIAG